MSLLRKTTQNPLPVCKPETGKNQYDIYPTHDLGPDKIFCDYTSLARRLAGQKQVVVDGYVGVRFDLFRQELNRALTQLGIRPVWWSVDAALRPQEEIERLVAPYLGGDDPIFGFRTPLRLEEFFDGEKLRAIAPDPEAEMNILVGTGAALAGWQGELVYIDIPKNEIQFRSRAGSIANLGATQPEPPKKMYKRFYFVDWVVLNRHKKELLPRIGIIVDGQREGEITWAEGTDLRRGLEHLAANGFRVRPWFEPGAWGGQWIREHIGALPHDVPNYAWSFELIVPENGLIFGSGGKMLEVSFDMVMFQGGEQVVGSACYDAYGDEFPIRMDYLDNFDGGNLSIQCHPQREYIRKNFGEVLTQEEMRRFLIQAKAEGMYELFLLDLTTGMRRGELLALRWDDLDFATGKLRIDKQICPVGGKLIVSEPKTKAANRTIILPPAMVEVLAEYKKGIFSDLMFPSRVKPEQPIDPGYVRKRLQIILERAGCKRIRFHDLRHTFTTISLEHGMDSKTLSAIIGHISSRTTLNIYTTSPMRCKRMRRSASTRASPRLSCPRNGRKNPLNRNRSHHISRNGADRGQATSSRLKKISGRGDTPQCGRMGKSTPGMSTDTQRRSARRN